jgi:hypothetical protein
MLSDTKNVKLGVCKLLYGGVDLGLTKGGVEVSVTTETHKVEVDQYGKTPINEFIMGRAVVVKAPLAETTLENAVRVLPGATLVDNGVAQVTTLDIDTPAASDVHSVTIDGKTYSVTADADPTEGEVALALVAAINADANCPLEASTVATGVSVTATVVLTGKIKGAVVSVVAGNKVSATLTTPAVAGAKRVDVTTGIGTDLLSIAKQLVLHPVNKADDDKSEDFIVYKAATPGAINFAYQLEQERIFNVEFSGYPDVANGNKLFAIGDPDAS